MSTTVKAIHKAGWLAAISASVAFSGSGVAADLALQDVPLFLSTGAEPNLMMMIDNSGSMENIVPDTPYNPATIYESACPAANLVSQGTRADLIVSSGSPRMSISGSTYTWGIGPSQRCFINDANYLAMLNTGGAGFLPAQYTGNYLNWYFDATEDPSGCSNTWSSGRKPCAQTRMMIAKTAGKNLVDSMSGGMRVGLSTYNNGAGGSLLEIIGTLNATKKTTLKNKIDGLNPAGNTPLAETLSDIGRYFANGYTSNLTLHPGQSNQATASVANVFNNHSFQNSSGVSPLPNPIQYSCQKSFAVLLTDGRPQADQAISTYLADYDGDCVGASPACLTYDRKPPATNYESAGSDYLNDVAQSLFEMDLRPDLVDSLGAKNNVATYLISFADDQAINDPLMRSTADQGGGEFFVAGNEAELTAAFQSAFASIVQKTSSASSASVNSGSISSETRIYQAKFNSASWTGQLLSFPLNTTTGNLEAAEWDASQKLPSPGQREIVTVNTDQTAVAFDWASLDATRQAQLDSNVTTAQALLNYLRGDDSNEEAVTNKFRVRSDALGPNKLGDIVSSSPLFVGRPPFRYRDSLESAAYSAFAATHQGRRGMVYAGANDGMLHGFDATDGKEVFAFIPGPVFARLRNLASQTYSHQFYVDGPPSMGDVFYAGAWHTVLVGGLNKGGQGIYALDITNPGKLATAEANPSSVVLWEFKDTDDLSRAGIQGDRDLGLTYSQPAIVRLRNGTWAAVFGNGYNNTATDTSASTTGNAVLYLVDIQTGTLIQKLDTGAGLAQAPTGITWGNGLATPALVDTNGDRTVEYAYAGDLYGNMWKFDLSSTDSADWKVAYGATAAPQPLYRARDASGNAQPITVRPEVSRGPFGVGMMVLFGTGKYLEQSDKLLTPVRQQTFYGIIDRNTGASTDQVANRTSLTGQQITNEISVDPDGAGPLISINVRITTNNSLGANSGWYLDLVSPSGYQAEKQVSNPIVRNGNVIFTTLIPDTNPCAAGGKSWIMEMSVLNGGRLNTTPFDINNDGEFTSADYVTLPDGTRVPITGIGSTEGILQTAGVIEGENGPAGGGGTCVQYKYMPGSSGGMQKVSENCGPSGTGRQSWRQVR